jgi:hypothetical protein
VARKPANFEWIGYTKEQIELLDFLDFIGNNAWTRNGQTEVLMPKILGELAAKGVAIVRVKEAMDSIGYSKQALHELDRWESKRTTGKFGP